MVTVYLKTVTHILAEAGAHNVSDAEGARLCALGVAEPLNPPVLPAKVEEAPAEEAPAKEAEKPKTKRSRRKAGK